MGYFKSIVNKTTKGIKSAVGKTTKGIKNNINRTTKGIKGSIGAVGKSVDLANKVVEENIAPIRIKKKIKNMRR